MQNFIEVNTFNGREAINIDHIYRVSKVSDKESDANYCKIYFIFPFKGEEGFELIIFESYKDVIKRIHEISDHK